MNAVASILVLVLSLGALPGPEQKLGKLTVTVQDPAGQPLVGAAVEAANWDYAEPSLEPLPANLRQITDADGRATFDRVTLGNVFVHVETGEIGGWYRVHEAGDGTQAEVTLTAGAGRTVEGRVIDEQGEPIAGVHVLADSVLPIGVTDAAGKFTLRHSGVTYEPMITCAKEGYAWIKEHLHFEPQTIEFTLKPGVRVEGRVVWPGGTPVADTYVSYYYHDSMEVRTDAQGKFSLGPVPVGERLSLSASARREEKPYSAKAELIPAAGGPAQVELVMELLKIGTVHGRVVDAESGKPVPGRIYQNQFDRQHMQRLAETDAEGRFHFDLIAGQQRELLALPKDPRYYPAGEPLRVKLDEGQMEVEVELKVALGAAIGGMVLDHEGHAKPDVWLSMQAADGARQAYARQDGKFLFPHLNGEGITFTINAALDGSQAVNVQVGPMRKGELREDVIIKLPPPIEYTGLAGVVVDTKGTPLGNVDLHQKFVNGDLKHLEISTTDATGRFTGRFAGSAQVQLQAYQNHQVVGSSHHENREIAIVEGGTVELVEGEPQELRVVVMGQEKMAESPPASLAVVVRGDPEDQHFNTNVRLLLEQHRSESPQHQGGGPQVFTKLPVDKYLLEVAAQHYITRVLEPHVDYDPSTGQVLVQLEKGPVPTGTSVWTAVTGRPATEEAVAGMFLGEEIYQRTPEFYQSALPPRPQPPDQVAMDAALREAQKIRVVDTEGRPVTRILVEPLQSFEANDERRLYKPPSGQEPRESADGLYMQSSEPMIISAPNCGRVFVRPFEGIPQGPSAIQLQPAATLVLRVLGEDGKPLPEAGVHLARSAWQGNLESYLVGKTNAQGTFRLEHLAPGSHGLYVHTPELGGMLAVVRLEPRQALEHEVTLHAPLGPAPASLLESFRGRRFEHGLAEIDKLLQELSQEQLETLGLYAHDQLLQMPREVRRNDWAAQEYKLLSWVLARTQGEAAVPVLADALAALLEQGDALEPPVGHWLTEQMLLAAKDDDTLINPLEKIVVSSTVHPFSRRAAVFGLQAIGTPAAAEAFARLRDGVAHGERLPEA